MMNIQWQNQVILVTGASGGIGHAVAKAFDEKGAHLILTGRDELKLKQLQQSLKHQHTIVAADISHHVGREKLIHICERLPVSMLINNAGTTHVGEFTSAPIESVMTTNLLSPMLLTQVLLPLLAQRPHAHVVNVGSAFGSIGFAAHSTYCATKFALKGWSEALHREYHDSNIRFHYLAPRATSTAINDERAVALNKALGNQVDTPEVVAQALIKLVEQNKTRFSIGFAERIFAKLNAILPTIVDNALAKKLPIIKHHTFSKKEQSARIDNAQNTNELSSKLI
ncbi:short chain dehydrogenase [Paraglaciecola agarilytica NO2]|uniref:Short chain dehydrogenase n=2 Tax=Paraglaciecola chathamensis TaxID=368405 RepID=A0ABQ0I3Z4_9ALTE|nr:SDR family oxidoreductase [Paraglaciecola agarilytica]GAC03779.1 short chain dehydrogenase [Paraglaciecola agarilytica NO2]